MKKSVLVLAFLLAALPAKPGRADPIPDSMLDKEYQACMSGPANGMEEQKKNYCLCIRNRLAAWDIDTYAKVAQDAARNANGAPAALQALARDCIAETMK